MFNFHKPIHTPFFCHRREHTEQRKGILTGCLYWVSPLIINTSSKEWHIGPSNQSTKQFPCMMAKGPICTSSMNAKQDSNAITLSCMIKGNGDLGKWHISSLLSMKCPIFLVFKLTSDLNTWNATQTNAYLATFTCQFCLHILVIKSFFNQFVHWWVSFKIKEVATKG